MTAPNVDEAYLQAVSLASADLRSLLQAEKATPLFIRLAVNDALTFDKATNTGGVNGSIRTRKELEHPGCEGLAAGIQLLSAIKKKFTALSYADLIQLAAVVAIAEAGGPRVTLAFGRSDTWGYPPPGRLPDPAASDEPVGHLRALAARVGMGLRQLVVLAGVHPLGRWWPDGGAPYYDRHHSTSPPRFSNAYFRDVLAGKKDAWLLADAETGQLVAEFAADEAVFRQEYALAHEALSRLGTRLTPQALAPAGGRAGGSSSLLDGDRAVLVQTAVAATAALAGAAIIAGLWWRRRRRLGL